MNRPIDPLETQFQSDEDIVELEVETDAAGASDAMLPQAVAAAKRKLITTIALTIDTCRWPFGDPVEADFHYCGELPLIGKPYCDKHDAQSYHATRPKKAAA